MQYFESGKITRMRAGNSFHDVRKVDSTRMKFYDLVWFGFAVHEFDSGWKPYLSGIYSHVTQLCKDCVIVGFAFCLSAESILNSGPWYFTALFIQSCESIFPICVRHGFNSSWLKMVTWPIWDLFQFNLIPSDGTISERLVTKQSACAKYVVLMHRKLWKGQTAIKWFPDCPNGNWIFIFQTFKHHQITIIILKRWFCTIGNAQLTINKLFHYHHLMHCPALSSFPLLSYSLPLVL